MGTHEGRLSVLEALDLTPLGRRIVDRWLEDMDAERGREISRAKSETPDPPHFRTR